MALVAVTMMTATASADARDKNCCFAVSVAVSGGYSVQYGSNPTHPRNGSYKRYWVWATRELVSYKDGRLHDLAAKDTVSYVEESSLSEHRFGTDATQDPIPCDGTEFYSSGGGPGNFADSEASQISLGETPAGKPAIKVGLSGRYAQLDPRCSPGEEGDHADQFSPYPWSYTVPGRDAKFFRVASQGDNFRPPDFSGGILKYSHAYEDAGVVSPHAFTGQSTVSVRVNYFPKSDLDDRTKQLEQCKEIGAGSCGKRTYPPAPSLDQDLSGVPGANP